MPAVVISPEHTQKKKYEVKCPLLSYRGDSSCLPLKMVFPASGARRQTLGELTVFPPALEQYAGGAVTRLGYAHGNERNEKRPVQRMMYGAGEAGRQTVDWLVENAREAAAERQRFVWQCLRKDLLHFKTICSFPRFFIFFIFSAV